MPTATLTGFGEPTWDTEEVHRHIANNEGALQMALRCENAGELRAVFEFNIPQRDEYDLVDWGNVDWEQILVWVAL